MELTSVRIFVGDLPAAVRFYADVVGLEQVGESGGVALFGRTPQIVIEAVPAACGRRRLGWAVHWSCVRDRGRGRAP